MGTEFNLDAMVGWIANFFKRLLDLFKKYTGQLASFFESTTQPEDAA